MTNFFKSRSALVRLSVVGLYFVLLLPAPADSQSSSISSWPDIKLPRQLQLFPISSDTNANGVPMRMQGFTSSLSVAAVIQGVQESLGQPLVINQIGKQIVMGRAVGAFYVTVQIESEGVGSRGVVAMTDMQSAIDNKEFARSDKQRWLDQLPAGSRLVSHVKSSDGLKRSVQIVYTNEQNGLVNADWLKTILAREGLGFERESTADTAATAGTNTFDQGKVFFLKGLQKKRLQVSTASQTVILLPCSILLIPRSHSNDGFKQSNRSDLYGIRCGVRCASFCAGHRYVERRQRVT